MSIIYNNSVTPPGSITMTAGCYDPVTNFAYIVENTTPSFRVFNLALSTQVLASACAIGPTGIALINAASAIVISTNVSTIDFIEVTTGHRSIITPTNGAATNSARHQFIAADTSLGVAFSCISSPSGSLMRTLASSQTSSRLTLPVGGSYYTPRCVILKSPGRWLVGGDFGKVYEIDIGGNIVDELTAIYEPTTGALTNFSGSNLDPCRIASLSYDTNMLMISVPNAVMLYDYSTKTKLWQQACGLGNSTDQTLLSNATSGYCYLFTNQLINNNQTITELDFARRGIRATDVFYTDNANNITTVVTHANLGTMFAIQQGALKIRYLSLLSGRDTTLRTFTVNPGGVHQQFRLILIDDTASPPQIVLDTLAQSPATYRVPVGKNILELIKVGNGTQAQWDYSEYTT